MGWHIGTKLYHVIDAVLLLSDKINDKTLKISRLKILN